MLAVLAALFGGKLAAAAAAKLANRYSWAEGLTMWSLSLPQLAATLAATITEVSSKRSPLVGGS